MGDVVRIVMCVAPPAGGTAKVALGLGVLLARENEVHVVSTNPVHRGDHYEGLRYHFTNPEPFSGRFEGLADLKDPAIVETIKALKPDVVHVHYAVPYLFDALQAAEELPQRPAVVATLHGTDVSWFGRNPKVSPRLADALMRADAVTTVSNSHRLLTQELLGAELDVAVIANFLPNGFGDSGAPPDLPSPRISHVSNLSRWKRPDICLDVHRRASEAHPSLRLDILGDGPERRDVEARADASDGRVVFHGYHRHPEQVVGSSAALLIPSELESFSLVALEAMAIGVPPVAFKVGGLPEVIEDGVTGFLVEPGDVDSMTARVLELIASPDLRARMGAEGRASARRRFSGEQALESYLSIYRTACRRAGRA